MAPSSPHGSALGGLTTQGATVDGARDMAKDAILRHLEALRKDGEEIPVGSDEEPCGELLAFMPRLPPRAEGGGGAGRAARGREAGGSPRPGVARGRAEPAARRPEES